MINNSFKPELIPGYVIKLLKSLDVTILLTLGSLLFGILLALGITALSLSKKPYLRALGSAYIGVLRGVPALILILLLYLGFPQFMRGIGIDMSGVSKEVYMIAIFSLFVAAGFSEIMRSSYMAVDKGQNEAALSVGMTKLQTFRRIIFPQAFAVALPSVGNMVIMLFKLTSLGFTIGIVDIMGKAKLIVTSNYLTRKLEVYIALAIVYWVICIGLEQINKFLIKQYTKGRKHTENT
jgi:L-cystine transport system permease protein